MKPSTNGPLCVRSLRILDNGGYNYTVEVLRTRHQSLRVVLRAYGSIVSRWSTTQFFVGRDPDERSPYWHTQPHRPWWHGGHCILFRTTGGREWIFIGSDGVFRVQFHSRDRIVRLISPVGNNGVPCTLAIGKTAVYFLQEFARIPTIKLCNVPTHRFVDWFYELPKSVQNPFKNRQFIRADRLFPREPPSP